MTRWAWLALLLAASSCTFLHLGTGDGGTLPAPADAGEGVTGGGRDGGAVPGLTAANACGHLDAAQCGALQRCGLVAPGEDALLRCVGALTETTCGPSLWPSRVAAGTLRLLPAVAAACAQAWVARPCELVLETPDVCEGYLQPAAGSGGPCYGGPWTECPAGEVCRGLSCPRTCRPRAGAGEDCTADADCESEVGLYCLPLGDGRTGVCTAPTTAGGACDERTRCAEGLGCGEDGLCAPLLSARSPCTAPGDCLDTLFCALEPGGGTCVARYPDGTPCTAPGQCRPGSTCVPQSGRCEYRGPLPRAASCGTGQSCIAGLACVGQLESRAGRCLTPLSENAPCTHSDDCAPHLACLEDAGARRCRPRQVEGGPCSSGRDCQAFSDCVGGSCRPLGLPGEACGGGCLQGPCAGEPGDGGTCAGLLGPNGPCLEDAACSSGRCVSGRCLAGCAP